MLPASVGITVSCCCRQEPKQQEAAEPTETAAPNADVTDPDDVSETPTHSGPAHPTAADTREDQTQPSSDGGGPRGNPGFTADVIH